MSFKIDFINKVVDQFRGWFQNQKPTSPSSSNVGPNSIRLPPNVPSSPTTESASRSVGNSKFHLNLNSPRSSGHVNSNLKNNNNNNNNHNNNNDSKYVNYYEQAAMNRQQQPVLPPSSLSLSTWSASPGTPSSGGSNKPASPYNNSFCVTSQHHQYHQQQQPHPLPSCNYSQTNSNNHHHNQNNNFNQSSSSSSASFGPPTPSSITTTTSVTTNHNNRHHSNDNPMTGGGLGPRSYSAINTPESPNNFRRQHSLNVNQRVPGSSRLLQLDLRNQKKSLYAKQSASTDLIDKHSLSPRPRPKDLSLSSSQDNMSKGYHNNNQMDGSSQPPSCTQNRPDKLFKMNPPPNHQVEGGIGGTANARINKYQFKLPQKLSYSMIINGQEYANLRERDFKKLEQLGAGNFGQVDKMLHIRSNTELAIKKMRRSGNIDDNRHVQRDLELLQKCNYIHVVQCYGFLLLETEVWIFMELMSTCFDHLIKKLAQNDETVPERVIGKVAVATIDALHYLKEEHNGIHRDIKPSNILINNQGIIKLCDFGISGSLINSRANSRSVGSTPYIAPERIEPPPDGYYDIRSDIWSMGITLVEIATGKFPYTDWSIDFEILSKVMLEKAPELPRDKDFSDAFRQFINACLIKDYRKRPKYRELMTYPFYRNYKVADVDVAKWFQQAYNGDNGDGNRTINQSTNNGS